MFLCNCSKDTVIVLYDLKHSEESSLFLIWILKIIVPYNQDKLIFNCAGVANKKDSNSIYFTKKQIEKLGIPDRKDYALFPMSNFDANYNIKPDDPVMSIRFGYLNGSNDPNGEVTIHDPEWGGYRSIYLPPKLPRDHGRFEIQRKNIEKLSTVKYYKTIKYDVHKKTFDFD